MEPCRPGKAPKEYKWCRCMSSCGSVESKYEIYNKNNINALHLIAEIYDDDRLHARWRNTWLREDYWTEHRQRILLPQSPNGDGGNYALDYKNYNRPRMLGVSW